MKLFKENRLILVNILHAVKRKKCLNNTKNRTWIVKMMIRFILLFWSFLLKSNLMVISVWKKKVMNFFSKNLTGVIPALPPSSSLIRPVLSELYSNLYYFLFFILLVFLFFHDIFFFQVFWCLYHALCILWLSLLIPPISTFIIIDDLK